MSRKEGMIRFWFYIVYRSLLVVAMGLSIYYGDILNGLLSVITLAITFIPSILERRFNVVYPSEFEMVVMVFIFLSIILGSVLSFYDRINWWDLFMHTLSGILIALTGFSLVYILNRSSWSKIQLSRAFVALFSFCFAVTLGAIWEIFEFSMDQLLGWNMQRSGLNDTMSDLIVDSIGALIVSSAGYIYLKGNIKAFERIEKRFSREHKERTSSKEG
ncbi:MAG: hypothetical protein JXA22_11030 [Candidatus Thermoplasmatota archaeon]|nr:hypothetical protein [Candidatus Thermoplasmatota archaeon]